MNPLDFLDTKSLWSLWYWITLTVAWSMTSHWTLGVPFDAIIRADRKGGEFAEQCEMLIQINVSRLIYYFDVGGYYFSGFIGFVLAALATAGFGLGSEFSIAIFMLLAPLVLVAAFSVRLAYKIRANGWEGEVLRRKLRWRRLWNQLIGVAAIFLTAIVAMLYYLSTIGVFKGF